MKNSIVRVLQVSVLVLGFYLLALPDTQTTVRADCDEACVETDEGDPGCLMGGGWNNNCDLWESWSYWFEVMLEAGCDDVSCGWTE